MTNLELVEKLKKVATNHKTLYVMGCFGAPLTGSNVTRYCTNHTYNKQAARTAMIKAAANQNPPVYGFDCVCLIKGVLWGWDGTASATYGGAKYASNGVPDINADAMINKCTGVTTDFSKIEVGAALWVPGHIGVYIGNGLAVECTPSFANKVQITAVSNIGTKSGYSARKWTKHGKLPYVTYVASQPSPSTPTPAPKPDGSAEQRIWDFLKGKGLNDYAVAGVMGNLYAESGLNPCNLQNTYNTKLGMSDAEYTAAVDNGSYTNFVRDSAGYGLVQWTYWSRKEALLNFAKAQKMSIGSLEMQLAFLWDELTKGYASVVAALKSATSIQIASTAILTQYERPADQSTTAQNKRAGFGKTYYDKYAKTSTPTHTPAPTNPTTGCKVGDIVNFSGGPVYSSANAATAAHTRNASRCKVTQVYNGKHPYHCISEDGKGVYGWVDAANVGAASASSPKIAVGSTVRITGDKYATGQGIPGWVKKSTHTVSQINGSKALLGANGGICSWVNLVDLTLA
jgi:hypothetical protein